MNTQSLFLAIFCISAIISCEPNEEVALEESADSVKVTKDVTVLDTLNNNEMNFNNHAIPLSTLVYYEHEISGLGSYVSIGGHTLVRCAGFTVILPELPSESTVLTHASKNDLYNIPTGKYILLTVSDLNCDTWHPPTDEQQIAPDYLENADLLVKVSEDKISLGFIEAEINDNEIASLVTKTVYATGKITFDLAVLNNLDSGNAGNLSDY